MADQWDWYRKALKEEDVTYEDGQLHSGFFWAKASKAGGRIPVAVYRTKDGVLKIRYGTGEINEDAARERWTWFCKHPISRDDYKVAVETGTWPDGTPTTAPSLPAGSNLPTDPFQRMMAEIDDKLEQAKAFLADPKAADRTRADMARNIQAQLLSLNKQADKAHKDEKQPHLDACRAVDEKYRFRDTVKGVADKLRTVFENWMRAEEARARAEADKKYKEEQAKAIAARAIIEAQQRKLMEDDPIQALTSPAPEIPDLPPPPEPVKVNVGGGIGRQAGLRTVWVPRITDYSKTIAHFAEHPDVVKAVEKIVSAEARVHKAATKIPGVEMIEDKRAA